MNRIEQSAELDWGQSRPEHSSALTDNDNFSARFTGQVDAPCEGLYEFEVSGNDGGRLWIDGERIIHLWVDGNRQGAKYLTAGKHDLKLDYAETRTSACAGRRRAAPRTPRISAPSRRPTSCPRATPGLPVSC
jgi:hypothetical protein